MPFANEPPTSYPPAPNYTFTYLQPIPPQTPTPPTPWGLPSKAAEGQRAHSSEPNEEAS